MSLFKKAAPPEADTASEAPLFKRSNEYGVAHHVRARMMRDAAWMIELDAEGYFAKLPAEDIPWVALTHVRGWGRIGAIPDARTEAIAASLAGDLPTTLGQSRLEIARNMRIAAEKVSRLAQWTSVEKLAVSRLMKVAWVDRRERYGVSGLSKGSWQYLTKRQKEDIGAIIAALHVDPREKQTAA